MTSLEKKNYIIYIYIYIYIYVCVCICINYTNKIKLTKIITLIIIIKEVRFHLISCLKIKKYIKISCGLTFKEVPIRPPKQPPRQPKKH